MRAIITFRDAGELVDQRYTMVVSDHNLLYFYSASLSCEEAIYLGNNSEGLEDSNYWGVLINGQELPEHVKRLFFISYKKNKEIAERALRQKIEEIEAFPSRRKSDRESYQDLLDALHDVLAS